MEAKWREWKMIRFRHNYQCPRFFLMNVKRESFDSAFSLYLINPNHNRIATYSKVHTIIHGFYSCPACPVVTLNMYRQINKLTPPSIPQSWTYYKGVNPLQSSLSWSFGCCPSRFREIADLFCIFRRPLLQNSELTKRSFHLNPRGSYITRSLIDTSNL